jgi:transcriptional regulator with XRE-family HTH domain
MVARRRLALCQSRIDKYVIIGYDEYILNIWRFSMIEVSERLKQLRESVMLSQMKLCSLNGCNQSSLARYENGQAVPPLKLLLWYADYFDVSMDFIFGRTDNPQGKLYEYSPKINADSEQVRQFIEMCFNPNSLVSEKLKRTMMDMFLQEGNEAK